MPFYLILHLQFFMCFFYSYCFIIHKIKCKNVFLAIGCLCRRPGLTFDVKMVTLAMHLWIFWKAVCMVRVPEAIFSTRSGTGIPTLTVTLTLTQTLTLLGLMSHLRFYHATLSCNFMKWQICSVQLRMLHTATLSQTNQTNTTSCISDDDNFASSFR